MHRHSACGTPAQHRSLYLGRVRTEDDISALGATSQLRRRSTQARVASTTLSARYPFSKLPATLAYAFLSLTPSPIPIQINNYTQGGLPGFRLATPTSAVDIPDTISAIAAQPQRQRAPPCTLRPSVRFHSQALRTPHAPLSKAKQWRALGSDLAASLTHRTLTPLDRSTIRCISDVTLAGRYARRTTQPPALMRSSTSCGRQSSQLSYPE